MITCIDSCTEPSRLKVAETILAALPGARLLDASLIVPGRLLGVVAQQFGLFSGFDELWCSTGRVQSDFPRELTIVAPMNLSSEPLPTVLAEWMITANCQLGLGDGDGLNFVTTEPATVERLQAANAK